MATVLFLSVPAHGQVNPTLGLVSELVKRGEKVLYFSSAAFKARIEQAGADFYCYSEDLDIFKAPQPAAADTLSPIYRVVQQGRAIIADILAQIQGQQIDYLIHSMAFLFAKPIAQILKVPTVSSLAVFAGLDAFFQELRAPGSSGFAAKRPLNEAIYAQACQEISEAYQVVMPPAPSSFLGLLFNPGDINLVYTSPYFAANLTYFNDTYKFVGPPVYDRHEQVDFPFELLTGKRVLYISLGTVFGSYSLGLYDIFCQSFADWDGVVVLAAHKVDLSALTMPSNFIVREYAPQSEVLRHTSVAITHAGMNSLNDLISHEVPFVCLPMGSDQPALAARAQELGATIVLDVQTVQPETLRRAVEQVAHEPSYLAGIREINTSFKAAGGYPRAVDEIFKLKAERHLPA